LKFSNKFYEKIGKNALYNVYLNHIQKTESVAVHIRTNDHFYLNWTQPVEYYTQALAYLKSTYPRNYTYYLFIDNKKLAD